MAEHEALSPRAMLDAWRAGGADRLDPVRFRLIEALARRADGYTGQARRVLDDKVRAQLDAYRDTIASAARTTDHAQDTVPPGDTASGVLAGLLAHMPARPLIPDPGLIDYFRDTWIQVRAHRELRHSVERVPENAGPLNSSHLVQRSLSLMGQMSPGYLQQFLSYVDALSSLERLHGAGALPGKEPPQAAGAKKGARGKPRAGGARPSS